MSTFPTGSTVRVQCEGRTVDARVGSAASAFSAPSAKATAECKMGLELTPEDFARAAEALGCDVAAVRAVCEVEAPGGGFLQDGRPKVLYEAHVFHRHTRGRHQGARDRHGVPLSSPKWDRKLYGKTGVHQHNRLADAAAIDWEAAHKSSSWGAAQILGENHVAAGYDTIRDFVDAMHQGDAGIHLDAMVNFIKTNKLDGPLRQHDWERFARGYNGPGFKTNSYDAKLAAAHRKWARA